jgi:hypothetical protein
MPKSSSRNLRHAVLASACLGFASIALPVACSSKAPEPQPVIGGCASDLECVNGHCTNGVCRPNCVPANNDCPTGQTCAPDGRCTDMGTGGTTGAGGTTGTGGTGTAGTIPISDAGLDSLDPDAACGTGSARAMLTPVSMFVMFDRSTSMIENPVDPVTDMVVMPDRWATASSALQAFFRDPTAADLAIGLRFFPHDTPAAGCTGVGMPNCDSMACYQPLVPLMADPAMPLPKLTADAAPTDVHEQTLVDAVTNSAPTPPGTGTPIYSALDGALMWATAYQAAHPPPAQQMVVVLVTDGEPTSCSQDTRDVNTISALAANAFMTSGVRTYTVGLSDSATGLGFLTQIAMAGGGQAFFVTDGPTSATELIAALKAIQGNALSCDFPYPTPDGEETPDPTRINVDYTPGTPGSMPIRFGKVADAAACGTEPGWYYDNPAMPTRIHLCPAACTAVTADQTAQIDIQIGCTSTPR